MDPNIGESPAIDGPAGTQPLVSVYIATRNRAQLLSRALASVWQQGRQDLEIVVVDDASDDETPTLLRRWAAQGQLRWLRNEYRLGACASRNLALRAARGHFATGLDDDDEMLSDRISTLLAALEPQHAFVCASDWILVPGRTRRMRIAPPSIDRDAILSRNIVGNQILAERTKILSCGGFDETLPAAQDYDLWIRMILTHGTARGLRQPLQLVHAPESETTPRISTSSVRRRGYWMVYRKHRAEMDPSSRRAHLYNLRRANGHMTRLPIDFRFYASNNRARLMWHALNDLFRRRSRV